MKIFADKKQPIRETKKYWQTLGPGFATGAADDDPSGVATYSQAGASSGFNLAWTAFFSFPLMGVVQEMCARIGLATGVGLATNIKRHVSKKALYFCTSLLLFANVLNIGADLGAMAESVQLVFPGISFILLVLIFVALVLTLQIFIPYKKYSKYLKYLALVLFAYVFSAFAVVSDWGEVLRSSLAPVLSFSKNEVLLICAVLGTTFSPYLFFWQTSQEVEGQIQKGEKTEEVRRALTTDEDIRRMRIDVWSGVFFSNLVMFFVVVTSAITLFGNGITNLEAMVDAARALKPLAGNFAFAVFAVGILGTGFLAIPVLAGSASYAISEAFNWREGLYRKFRQAGAFYGVIIAAVVLGMTLNLLGLNPIKTLIYSAVLNGIISPVILFFILRLSGSEEVMGAFRNRKPTSVVGWLIVGLLSVVSLTTIVFIFK